MNRLGLLAALLIAATALVLPAVATSAAQPTLLRLDGIGPLKLGMTRSAAVKTGWLSGKTKGCELESPVPVVSRLTGPEAPNGLDGSATFRGGRLSTLSFTTGVRTALGVKLGTTVKTMVKRYKAKGFKASSSYSRTFHGTFVTVSKGGKQVLGAFADGSKVTALATPSVPVCE